MTKNLFKWMMALAIVASPMVFTACGDEDDDSNSSQGGQPANTVTYSLDEEVTAPNQASKEAISSVRTAMITSMFSSVGQTYDASEYPYAVFIIIAEKDSVKMLNTLQATYARIKDTDLQGGYYKFTVHKAYEQGVSFEFGSKPVDAKVRISFESQQLNADNYWIGDSEGVFSYSEGGVTVTGTQSSYDGIPYWSGFAISGRKENTFANLTPDQYNSAKGGTTWGDKFLVVQGPYNDYECLTFDQPVKVLNMHCTNSAYSYSSMTKGDSYAGDPFTKEDWFSGYITCFNENGDTISTTEVKLAEKDVEGKNKYLDYWHVVRINAENVKKIKFSFDGSRKGEWGLNTPAYMCVDEITVERQ